MTTDVRSIMAATTFATDFITSSTSLDVDPSIATTSTFGKHVNASEESNIEITLTNGSGIFEATISIDTIYVVIGSLGVIGNLFVMVIILNGKRILQKITNMYILNQSILDFCASFFLICTSFGWGVSPNSLNRSFAEFICKFWTAKYPLWALIVSSTYNLLIITMERYMEVVHPIKHKVSCSRRLAYVTIALTWLIGPLWQTYFFATSQLEDGRCAVYSVWPSELVRQIFGILNVCVQFIFPLSVLIYAYSRILFVITHRIHAVNQPPQLASQGTSGQSAVAKRDDRWQGARRNTLKTMVLVAAVFVLCWSQNQLYFLLMNLGMKTDFSSPYYHFTVVCIFCNPCLNPFIYALKYRELQNAARVLLGRCWARLRGRDFIEEEIVRRGSTVLEHSFRSTLTTVT